MQRYQVLNTVGEGTYGIVLRCIHKKTGTFVAIKQFKESNDEERVRVQPCLLFQVKTAAYSDILVAVQE